MPPPPPPDPVLPPPPDPPPGRFPPTNVVGGSGNERSEMNEDIINDKIEHLIGVFGINNNDFHIPEKSSSGLRSDCGGAVG